MKTENRKQKIENRKPDIRRLYDVRSVLYDQKWAKGAPNFEVYFMHRGIKIENEIKQNITIFPPLILGKEFTKTKGHEHKGSYREVYKVIKGKAIFLLQKRKPNSKKIEDVYVVKANKNEVVIIPSSYGHITINPTNKVLETMDWSCENCKSDYYFFEKMGGACYYYTIDGWIKNKNYKKIPKLHFKKPLKSMPKNLNFLKRDVQISH